jgi:hypothetical protein
VTHDRIHAREPTHHVDRWTRGTIESVGERDGHCVVTVEPAAGADAAGDGEGEEEDRVELVVTFAVRDLFLDRLDLADDESPVGETVWYREHGGN